MDLQDARRRLRTGAAIAGMILDGHPDVTKDERAQPELRDIIRVAAGKAPRTKVGRHAYELAERDAAEDEGSTDEEEGAGDCG